jgi:hypothetical protein
MGNRMVHDFALEDFQLGFRRKKTVNEKIGCFQMGGVQGQLFDGVASESTVSSQPEGNDFLWCTCNEEL